MPADPSPDDGAIPVQLSRNSGSAPTGQIHIGEDRRVEARRSKPTRPWSRLFGHLRRARGRRLGDRANYVDVYSRQDVLLLLTVFLLNVGDAFFTMMWLERGGREANPIMDFFLDIGPGAFIAQKCFIVGFWLILLLVHKNFRFARIGLYAALTVYGLLMILHFGIIAFGVTPPGAIPESPDGENIVFEHRESLTEILAVD